MTVLDSLGELARQLGIARPELLPEQIRETVVSAAVARLGVNPALPSATRRLVEAVYDRAVAVTTARLGGGE